MCETLCVDTSTDPNHCGDCDTVCPGGHACEKSQCSTNCMANLTNCGGACVNLVTNRSNCGACALSCGDLTCHLSACHGCTLSFAVGVNYAPGPAPESIAIADLNDDGQPDLVISIHGDVETNGYLRVLLNQGAGVFGQPADYDIGKSSCTQIRIADFDGNSRPDVVLACGTPDDPVDQFYLFLNQGDGTFSAPQTTPLSSPQGGQKYNRGVGDIAVGDLNGDGSIDLLAVNAFGTQLLANQGGGLFKGPVLLFDNPNGVGTWSLLGLGDFLAIADVDNDKQPDIVTTLFNGLMGWTVLFNQGAGSFSRRLEYDQNLAQGLALGDLNRDGFVDVVWTRSGNLGVYLNEGNGAFGPVHDFPQTSVDVHLGEDDPTWLKIADFDGDGQEDIAFTRTQYAQWTVPPVISIGLNRGGGDFSGQLVNFGAGVRPGAFAVGDLNGDGKPDLAITNSNVSVLLNTSSCK